MTDETKLLLADLAGACTLHVMHMLPDRGRLVHMLGGLRMAILSEDGFARPNEGQFREFIDWVGDEVQKRSR